jgi:hypothetical protein
VSGLVALGGVVEDDVENHLEICRVEGLDHPAELVDLPAVTARRGVTVVRREVPD